MWLDLSQEEKNAVLIRNILPTSKRQPPKISRKEGSTLSFEESKGSNLLKYTRSMRQDKIIYEKEESDESLFTESDFISK